MTYIRAAHDLAQVSYAYGARYTNIMASAASNDDLLPSRPSTPTRFYPALDITLLKEVIAVNPYDNSMPQKQWEAIAAQVNSTLPSHRRVTLRACKDRTKTLLKAHKADEMQSLKASGTSEEYSEREQLLTELSNLMDEVEREKKKEKQEKQTADIKEHQGKAIREAAMNSLKKSGVQTAEDQYDVKRRRKSGTSGISDYLEILKEKQEKEQQIKMEQLRLEREKFELEKKEREQRMQHDTAMMALLQKLVSEK